MMGRVNEIYEEMKKKKNGGRATKIYQEMSGKTSAPTIKPAVQTIVNNAKKPLPMPGQRTQHAATKPSLATLSPQQMTAYNRTGNVIAPNAQFHAGRSVKDIEAELNENKYSLTENKVALSDAQNRLKKLTEQNIARANSMRGTISSPVANLDEIRTLGALVEKLKAENKALSDKGKTLEDEYIEKTGRSSGWEVAGASGASGLAQFNKDLASTLDLIIPTDFLGKYDPISKLNDYYSQQYDLWEKGRQKTLSGHSDAVRTASDIGVATVNALPQLIAAVATGGGSAAVQGGKLITGAANTGLWSTLKSSVSNMMKNPSYWTSVAQTLGNDYETAKANGANELEASTYAVISSLLNAGIEVGGGLEKLPDSVKSGGRALMDWIKSSLEEGREEVVQGLVSRSMEMLIYDHDKKLYSSEDANAIINPKEMAKEYGMGTAVGAVLGSVPTAANVAANAINNKLTAAEQAQKNTAESGGRRIVPDMDDNERASILAEKRITVPTYDSSQPISTEEVSRLKGKYMSGAKNILKRIAEKCGVFRSDYYNADVDLQFEYSKSSYNESRNKQTHRSNSSEDFGKMLTLLPKIIDGAVEVEAHTDKYTGTGKEDANLKEMHVLLGAFHDGERTVPVQLEIKEFKQDAGRNNKLYVTVTLNEKELGVTAPDTLSDNTQTHENAIPSSDEAGITPQPTDDNNRPLVYSPPASEISITDLLAGVKDDSGYFFKYIPDSMLNNARIESKKAAIAEDEARIAKMREEYAAEKTEQQKPPQQTRDVQAPQSNVRNASADDGSANSIPQTAPVVNTGNEVLDRVVGEVIESGTVTKQNVSDALVDVGALTGLSTQAGLNLAGIEGYTEQRSAVEQAIVRLAELYGGRRTRTTPQSGMTPQSGTSRTPSPTDKGRLGETAIAQGEDAGYNKKRTLPKIRNKKHPKLGKTEYTLVQRAQISKYGGMEEGAMPDIGYVYAYDMFYYIENYGPGEFRVIYRFDPATAQERIKFFREVIDNGYNEESDRSTSLYQTSQQSGNNEQGRYDVDSHVAGNSRGIRNNERMAGETDIDTNISRDTKESNGSKRDGRRVSTTTPIVDTQGRALGLDGAPYARAGAGLVRDANYRRANIPARKARVLDAIAKVTGTKIRFVPEINGGRDNARYKDGVIEIALNCKNPVGVAFTHELVHRIRDVDPEVYEELKRYVYENMDEQSLRRIEEKTKNAYAGDETVDIQEEVVADAFGYILGDSVRLEQFVRDNRKTSQKIYDWMHDLIIRIKKLLKREGWMTREALYAGNGTKYDTSGKKVFAELAGDLDAMAQALSNALEATAQAVQDGTEQHATVGAKYSKGTDADSNGIKQQLRDAQEVLNEMEVVASATVPENMKSKRDAANWAIEVLKRRGYHADRQGFGSIRFSEKDIRYGVNYADTPEEKAAFAVLYDVLKKGVEIGSHGNHKMRQKETVTFAAPVELNGIRGNMAVVVEMRNKNYYAHRILFPDGTVFKFSEIKKDTERESHQGVTENGSLADATSSVSASRVPQSGGDVNSQSNSKSSRMSMNEVYRELIEEYGEMKPGEKPAREVQVPKKTGEGKYVRRGARTIMEAGSVPDEFASEMEQEIVNGTFSYEPQGDKRTLERVNADIEYNGWEESLARWDAVVNGTERASKENIVLGETLLVQAANAGDTELAMKLAAELAAEATRAGQEIQAIRLLKKMSPEGRLYHAQKHISKLQEEINERHGRGKYPIVVPKNLYDNLINATTEEEMRAAEEALYTRVAEQIPTTLYDQWNAWRYIAMLANPRTHIKNFVGNFIFMPMRGVKNMVKIVLESAMFRKSNEYKTASLKAYMRNGENKELRKFIKEDRENNDVLKSNSKYTPESIISEKRKVFTHKALVWLDWVRKNNLKVLEKSDMFFKKTVYDNSMLQYMLSNKYTAEFLQSGTKEANQALERGRQYALDEALKATFQDANKLAESLNKMTRIKKGDSAVAIAGKVAAEGTLPFKKTPMNIVKRGVEYSPVGLLDGVCKSIAYVAMGKYTPMQAIDRLASGITGTGLIAMGLWLAYMGFLKGKLGDDKEDEFKKLQGEQGYAMVIGDISYTLDWAAPAVLPLFVGVEIYEQMKSTADEDKSWFSNTLDALSNVTEPMLEMSMLQGLQDVIDNVSFSDNKLSAVITSALSSYVTQGVPTLFGQIARTIDPVRRSTYASKSSKLTKGVERTLRKAGAKTPGLSTELEPYVDEWGREGDNGGIVERAFENFISPGYYSKKDTDAVEREIARLYAETSEGSVLPKRAASSFSYKEKTYYKTPEEYTKYQKTFGGTSYKLREAAYKDGNYKRLTDEEKVTVSEKIAEVANARAKIEFFKGRDVKYEADSFIEKLDTAKKAGVPEHVVIIAWALQKDVESIKDEEGEAVNYSASLRRRRAIDKARPSLSIERRRVLYEMFGVGKDVIEMTDASVETRLKSMEKKYAQYNRKKKGA